jgi:hypothetical protein
LQSGEINLSINESKLSLYEISKLNFGKSIFGTDGNFNDYMKQSYEKNTEYENYLYNLLIQWYNGSMNISDKLYKEKDNIKLLTNKYPEIFKSPKSALIYRYLSTPQSQLLTQITDLCNSFNNNQNKNKVYLFGEQIIIKNIKYKPHRSCTSWTINYDTAKDKFKWHSLIEIMSMTDSDCFMNPNISSLFELDFEEEIIHFGYDFTKPMHLIFHKSNDLLSENITDTLINAAIPIINFKTLF